MPNNYSPLRYPGGKSKLYDIIQPIVANNIYGENRIYIEPFAGGSGLALRLLFNNDIDRLVLNDVDTKLFYFWDACLNNTDELCEKIADCTVDIDTWDIQKRIYSLPTHFTPLEVGFASFFLNRCNVSGVLSGGPIGGREQSGTYLLNARFNKNNLIKRIQQIGAVRDRIVFYNYDAIYFLLNIVNQFPLDNTLLNIDPPYVNKGPNLYENSFTEADHAELSNIISLLEHKWIVTYDKCALIDSLYSNFRRKTIILKYSAGAAKEGKELLIYSNRIQIPIENG